MGARDPRVDAYIETLPDWQQDVCYQVRDLILDVDPEMEETIKRTRLPYYVLAGTVCSLLGTKDHVNVFMYGGGNVPDPDGIVTSGHGNQTGRLVSIYEGDVINKPALRAMIAHIVADNRAGGWRKLTRKP